MILFIFFFLTLQQKKLTLLGNSKRTRIRCINYDEGLVCNDNGTITNTPSQKYKNPLMKLKSYTIYKNENGVNIHNLYDPTIDPRCTGTKHPDWPSKEQIENCMDWIEKEPMSHKERFGV